MRAGLLAVLILGAAGALWWSLRAPEGDDPDPDSRPVVRGGRSGEEPAGRSVEEAPDGEAKPVARPKAALDRPWPEIPLRLAAGSDPVRGRDILAEIEKSGTLVVRAPDPKDLEAFRGATLDLPRDAELYLAMVPPAASEAGFLVQVHGSVMLITKAPEGPPRER